MTPRVETIGDCQLWLGDCREIVPQLGKVDMIFCDPPYGHNNNNGDLISKWEQALGRGESKDARPIANDGHEANDLAQWLFNIAPTILANGGCCCCCCCCGGGGPDPQFARWSLWMDGPLQFKQMVVWDKGPMGMGWHYRRSYETVLVGEKRGGACKWYDTSNAIENIIRPGQYGAKKIIPSKEQHPTEKPVGLAAHFIRLHSLPGEIVLDPFFGGGSTALACVEAGRRFVGCEIDPHWFEYTLRRLEKAEANPRLFEEPPPKPKQEALL